MANFNEYRREDGAEGLTSNSKNMRPIGAQKLFAARFVQPVRLSANSSVCVPNWNFSRLKRAEEMLKNNRVSFNRTDIIFMCVRPLLKKVRAGEFTIIRTRKKNDAVYKYSKISTYCSTHRWDMMHARALHLKVSFSQLVDIALRMYLKVVLQRLLGLLRLPLKLWGEWALVKQSLLHLGNYQKIVSVDKPGSLIYTISLALGPPLGKTKPKPQ